MTHSIAPTGPPSFERPDRDRTVVSAKGLRQPPTLAGRTPGALRRLDAWARRPLP